MKTINIIFTSMLAVPALLLAGCSSNPEASEALKMKNERSSGYVVIDRNNIDAGTIRMSDGKVEVPFSFRNGGNGRLVLLEGRTNCMCTEAVVKSDDGVVSPRFVMRGHGPAARVYQILDPGETAQLIATFDPNAHGPSGTGPVMRDVVLNTNSEIMPVATFRFSGTVVP